MLFSFIMQHRVPIVMMGIFILLGCEAEINSVDEKVLDEFVSPQQEPPVNSFDISEQLWSQGQQQLLIVLRETEKLYSAIDVLLSYPSEDHLDKAREQWQQAYFAFVQAQPLLYFDLLTDVTPNLDHIVFWPFYPGFIDSFGQYRDSGIVNAIDTPLNASQVRHYHQQFESSELILGFFPIAYLLWGEYEARPVSDFLAQTDSSSRLKEASVKITQLPQNRRRQLLRLQSEWLLHDMTFFHNLWAEGQWYERYHQQLPDERLRGLTESLIVALDNVLTIKRNAEPVVLPFRFIEYYEMHQTVIIASVEQLYLQGGLADYWLDAQERASAELMFSELKQMIGNSDHDDWSDNLAQLIQRLSPDTIQEELIE